MKTNCKIHMEFIDTTAIDDCTVSTTFNASFGNLLLFKERTGQLNYGTLELNQFILDGSRVIMPDYPTDVTFWSNAKSGSDCTFSQNPVITYTFTENHTSAGLKFFFADEYPKRMKITWFSLGGSKLDEQIFYPDELDYFCKYQVANYGRVVVEFLETVLPERYIKLQYVKYGVEIDWSGTDIQRAELNEEIDVTSAKLTINTADVDIIDYDNNFDLQNHNGTWVSIQKEQELTITEEVEGKEVDCGTFYIDSWESESNVVSFDLIDLIGLLDKTSYYGGRIYENVKAGVIIDDIMASYGTDKYTVDDDVYNTLLSGYLAIQTHRKALQQVVFACGAVADCSRSNLIKIYKPDRYVRYTVGIDRKFLGTTIEVDDYVSGVAISYNVYSLADKTTVINKDTLTKGLHRIEFNTPYDPTSFVTDVGTITEAHTNYLVVDVPSDSVVNISGVKYESEENTVTANVGKLEAGEIENVKKFSKCTLVNREKAQEVAEYILNYYQLRQIVKMRFINEGEAVGNWLNIKDTNENVSTTGIVSQKIDLTGGNISEIESRGYSRVITDFSYTGEIYCGEYSLI